MKECKKNIMFWDALKEQNNSFWCVGRYDNALYLVDFEEQKAERIVGLPRTGKYVEFLYTFTVKTENYIICLPQNGFSISMFNKKTGVTTNCEIKKENKYSGYNSIGGLVIGDKVYTFSCYSDIPALEYDIKKNEINELYNWAKIKELYGVVPGHILMCNINNYKTGVIFGINGTGIIIYYDILTNNFTELTNISGLAISKIYLQDDTIYAISKADIAVIDIKTWKCVKKYTIEGIEKEDIANILLDKDILVVIPRYGNNIYYIDLLSDECIDIEIGSNEFININKETNRYFYNGRIDDNEIILYPYNCDKCVYIDKNTYEYNVKAINCYYEDISEYVEHIYRGFDNQGIIDEKIISIENYLDLIIKK